MYVCMCVCMQHTHLYVWIIFYLSFLGATNWQLKCSTVRHKKITKKKKKKRNNKK